MSHDLLAEYGINKIEPGHMDFKKACPLQGGLFYRKSLAATLVTF